MTTGASAHTWSLKILRVIIKPHEHLAKSLLSLASESPRRVQESSLRSISKAIVACLAARRYVRGDTCAVTCLHVVRHRCWVYTDTERRTNPTKKSRRAMSRLQADSMSETITKELRRRKPTELRRLP